MINKRPWLDAAEIFDAWRIVPRIVLFTFGGWTIGATLMTLNWYFHMATPDRTAQDAALVGTIITAVTGLFTVVLKAYLNSGRDWTDATSSSSTVVATEVKTSK